jgi:BCD family chlorophyll transporter-like MFS transporter
MTHTLGWLGIVRLGLVQSALGGIVVLTTATLNRVMVVELSLAASLPAALVAWHFAVQLSRPVWGHGSDKGRGRTPWIIGGMGLLAMGALLATNATLMSQDSPMLGTILNVIAFTLIGAGVGAAGTTLLALMASEVAKERRPAAAAITWIMMVIGIAVTAGVSGQFLDPYSPQRLALVAAGVCGIGFLLTLVAVRGVEKNLRRSAEDKIAEAQKPRFDLREVLSEIWNEDLARNFTIFVFFSMLAYSAQDLILEPYAGLVFGYTVGQSTSLSGVQHGGVLLGMIIVGLAGALIRGDKTNWLRHGTFWGCSTSALALIILASAGFAGLPALLQPAVFALGFANGIFAVSAVGLMFTFASAGQKSREGVRLGVWGAAQAIAFGLGGFLGAIGLDVMRQVVDSIPVAFVTVFSIEAGLFMVAAAMAMQLGRQQLASTGLNHAQAS